DDTAVGGGEPFDDADDLVVAAAGGVHHAHRVVIPYAAEETVRVRTASFRRTRRPLEQRPDHRYDRGGLSGRARRPDRVYMRYDARRPRRQVRTGYVGAPLA